METWCRVHNITEKRRERPSLRVANESRFTWSSMDEYGNVSDEADSPTRRQFAV